MTRITAVLLVATALLLGGCSTGLKLAYANLERLALWQIGDYVTLDDAQKAAFREEFAALKAWHRREQLPQQIDGLRRLAAALRAGQPPGPATVAMLEALERDALAAWAQAQPGVERLLARLDDAQVADYDRAVRKRLERQRREHADDTADDRRADWLDRWHDALKRWIGRPNPAQNALLAAGWTAEQPFLQTPDAQAATRLARHQRFLALLATRRQPGLTTRLRDEADAREHARDDASRHRERVLLGTVLDAADAQQRARYAAAVAELADDLASLLATPASGAAGPT